MFSKTQKEIPNTIEGQVTSQLEISYTLLSDMKNLDSFVIKIMNNLTGYNHLMSLNEQVVKHELRTKFILESLSVLQKTIKDKQ